MYIDALYIVWCMHTHTQLVDHFSGEPRLVGLTWFFLIYFFPLWVYSGDRS